MALLAKPIPVAATSDRANAKRDTVSDGCRKDDGGSLREALAYRSSGYKWVLGFLFEEKSSGSVYNDSQLLSCSLLHERSSPMTPAAGRRWDGF